MRFARTLRQRRPYSLCTKSVAQRADNILAANEDEIAQAMEDDFDRIEVICTLHANLIDQHHFSKVLTALASPEDKENVWQRIKIAKKGGASRF